MSETLKFHFTPVDGPRPDQDNPHAKAATHVPEVVEALREQFGEAVLATTEYAGEQTVYVAKDRLFDICVFLKTKQGFNYLTDLGGIDRFTEDDRFEVMYNLISIQGRKRLRLKVRVDEDDLTVPSVVDVWKAANWNERECWDMFGIRFEGHPDLRRMLMPEDFEHFPLRKEFPSLGIPGSLPLPSFSSDGKVEPDPFAAARRTPDDA